MVAMRTPSKEVGPASASQFFTVDPLVNVIQLGLRFHAWIRAAAFAGTMFV